MTTAPPHIRLHLEGVSEPGPTLSLEIDEVFDEDEAHHGGRVYLGIDEALELAAELYLYAYALEAIQAREEQR
jgi:hypothetical protein